MNWFTSRRIRNGFLLYLALAAIVLWVRLEDVSLRPSSFTTGYILLGAVAFLALYNIRKKLAFLPLGSSSTWLQWHIYVGLGTIVLFGLHLGPKIPHGALEITLAVLYVLTTVSGIVGLYMTRTIPRQLARVGEEFIYERIPQLRRQVSTQASNLALQAVAQSGATTLADFYAERLYDYFSRSRGIWYHVRPTSRQRRTLMQRMRDLERYLNDEERGLSEQLFALVRKKDDLDFHEARQRLLKWWLFGHIALSYALLILAMLHGILAHAFHGGGV
jgi:hypothetical protein